MDNTGNKVLSFANFKGGVGKTTTTALVSYSLAKMGYKTLVIDFDAQANLTSLFLKTKAPANSEEIITIDKGLMSAINDDIDLSEITIEITANLDLIANAVDFSFYPRFLERNFDKEIDRIAFFRKKIEPLRELYDYIFIDVPPTLSLLNDTAFYACDQIIVVLQTQERSLVGAEVFIQYLQDTLIDEFHSDVDILGILPVLSKKGGAVDEYVLDAIKKEFGEENLFKEKVQIMERLKRFDVTGITDSSSDIHDKRVHKKFTNISAEMLDRLDRKAVK